MLDLRCSLLLEFTLCLMRFKLFSLVGDYRRLGLACCFQLQCICSNFRDNLYTEDSGK